VVQSLHEEYFTFFFSEIMHPCRIPRRHRGALRPIVTKRGPRDAMDAKVSSAFFDADERHLADDKGVWSWRPLAGAKRAEDDSASDGDYEVTDTGESTR